MFHPWSSIESTVIDIVLFFLNNNDKYIGGTLPESTDPVAREAREQFPLLASAAFRCFQERLDWLERQVFSTAYRATESSNREESSPLASDEPGIELERFRILDRFERIRKQIFSSLRTSN